MIIKDFSRQTSTCQFAMGLLMVGILLTVGISAFAEDVEASKPNIIFFLADDLDYSDLK